jgi:hypothetical protein
LSQATRFNDTENFNWHSRKSEFELCKLHLNFNLKTLKISDFLMKLIANTTVNFPEL